MNYDSSSTSTFYSSTSSSGRDFSVSLSLSLSLCCVFVLVADSGRRRVSTFHTDDDQQLPSAHKHTQRKHTQQTGTHAVHIYIWCCSLSLCLRRMLLASAHAKNMRISGRTECINAFHTRRHRHTTHHTLSVYTTQIVLSSCRVVRSHMSILHNKT